MSLALPGNTPPAKVKMKREKHSLLPAVLRKKSMVYQDRLGTNATGTLKWSGMFFTQAFAERVMDLFGADFANASWAGTDSSTGQRTHIFCDATLY
jgi:hypothetical protein